MTPDNGHSMGGSYGLRNEMVTWLIGIGRGDVAALSPAEFQKPMDPPKCPKLQHSDQHDLDYVCRQTMLYRGDYWLCPHDKTRLPVKLFDQPTPKLIDWGDGSGPVPFKGGIATLIRLADKQIDVEYSPPWPGRESVWKYVVRA